MKNLKKKFIFLILLGSGIGVSAQYSVNSGGNDTSGSGGSVSYSVGQTAYITTTATNGSVAEGVQQPFEISIVTIGKKAEAINLKATVFPNPTFDYITLELEESYFETFNYQLCDMNGKVLLDEKSTGNNTRINMGNLPPSIYFLTISNCQELIKTFKINKK